MAIADEGSSLDQDKDGLMEDGLLYRKWRDHLDDFLQNPNTMSGTIQVIASTLPKESRDFLEGAAQNYAENFTLLHHFAGRVEKLEAQLAAMERGAARVQEALGLEERRK